MSLQNSILTVGKFEHYSVSQHGITFQEETPRDAWLDAVKRLTGLYEGAVMTRERTLMLLADTLNFGETRYGEEFSQAVDGMRRALGLTPKTIANAQWVYRQIDSTRRRDGLQLGHYSVVAALPEADADELLSDALARQASVNDLKAAVAEKFPKTKRGKPRKKKATDSETAATAFQKLVDVTNYFAGFENAALLENVLSDKWKTPMEKLYRAFRRKWQSGRKK